MHSVIIAMNRMFSSRAMTGRVMYQTASGCISMDVENAFCRVVDQTGKELARYKLTEQGSHTGIVISSLRRNNGNWDFTALGHACRGRTIDDMHSDIVSAVIR